MILPIFVRNENNEKIDIYDKYIHIYQYGLLVCFDMCKYIYIYIHVYVHKLKN